MSIFKCAESELTQSEGRFYIFWRVVWVLAIPVSAFFFLSLPLYLDHFSPCPTPEPFLALRVCCPCLVLKFLFTENTFHFWLLGQELIKSRKAAQLTLKHLTSMAPAAALANFACLTFSAFFASPQISLQKDNCSLSDAASSKTFSLFPFCSNWPELIRVLVFLTPRFLLNYSQIQLKVFPTTLVFSPLDHCLCCLILIQIASFNIQLQETFCGFLDRVWLQSDGASCLNCFLPLWIPKITFIWTFAARALYVFHSLWFAPLRWLQSWTCCTVEQCKHLVRSPNRTY